MTDPMFFNGDRITEFSHKIEFTSLNVTESKIKKYITISTSICED